MCRTQVITHVTGRRPYPTGRNCANILLNMKAFSLMILCAICAVAQTTTGTVSGFIRDSSDAPISGAGVKLTNVNTGYAQTTSTSVDGAYTFPLVPPGSY